MVSLQDIAASVGCSVRTVRRAMNGDRYVNDEKKRLVMEASRRLGYRPNLTARTLRTGRSSEVSVLLDSIDELYMEMLAGLEDALRRAGYSVHVLFMAREAAPGADVARVVDTLISRRPAGLAVFRNKFQSVLTETLLGMPGLATIALDPSPGDTIHMDAVRIDRAQGVSEAVKYLAATGRWHIAYCSGGAHAEPSRLNGYHRAVTALGRADVVLEVPEGPSHAARYDSAVAVWKAMRPRPDAMLVFSDVQAMRILAALYRQGVSVPGDLALVGFDNREFSGMTHPPLTTVAQPSREVGAKAAEILLRKISGEPPPDGGWSVMVPTSLVVRGSG